MGAGSATDAAAGGGSGAAVTLDPAHTSAGMTLSGGNLTVTQASTGALDKQLSRSTTAIPVGQKGRFEFKNHRNGGSNYGAIGVAPDTFPLDGSVFLENSALAGSITAIDSNFHDGNITNTHITASTSPDVWIAIEVDNQADGVVFNFYSGGVLQGTVTATHMTLGLPLYLVKEFNATSNGASCALNFGDTGWNQPVTTGWEAVVWPRS